MKKIVLILLAALGATSTTVAVLGATSITVPEVDERDALMALYNSTDGPNWTNNTGWGTGDPCDDPAWYGVECDTGHVTFLVLSYNQLTGPIPPELGNLRSLGGLFLNNNQLTGSVPPELGDLSSLRWLDLDSNQLSGPMPPELGNLSSLTGLSLYSNQLSGPIPPELGNLSSLEYLYLYYNQLSGPIPSELGNLSSLGWLYLNENPALVCWQTQEALIWAMGLSVYEGPDVVCLPVCLPMVMSSGD